MMKVIVILVLLRFCLKGIKEEELEKIKSNLKGIHWGFSTTPKQWTSEEQKNAVEKEKKKAIERNKRLDALQMAL